MLLRQKLICYTHWPSPADVLAVVLSNCSRRYDCNDEKLSCPATGITTLAEPTRPVLSWVGDVDISNAFVASA